MKKKKKKSARRKRVDKDYRTNVDTIGLNMDEVEQEFGLPGAAHKSNKLPEPPEELWKPSRLYKKGVSISKSVSKGVGYGKKK